MNNVLCSLATLPKLRAAWRDFWRNAKNQKSRGIDGMTPADFNYSCGKNLQQISDQLLEGYRFDNLVAHPVPKPDGKKERIICVPTVRDRLVQRIVGAHFGDQAKWIGILNDASFGFIKGRGTPHARDRAIELRRQHPWAYKSDISSFFDQIPRDKLYDAVSRSVRTPSLNDFLRRAINCEIDIHDPVIRRKMKNAGIVPGLGVRQGMPLSPFFANVLLKDFDRAFLSRGQSLVRYADDFIIFADNERQCIEADTLARNVLAKIGLEIPEPSNHGGKTQICSPKQRVEFLGLSLELSSSGNYELVITSEQLENIKRNIGLLGNLDYLIKRNITIASLTKKLEGKISGYKSAYPSSVVANYAELEELLDRMRVRVLTKIFSGIFGSDVLNHLTKKQKKFLLLEYI